MLLLAWTDSDCGVVWRFTSPITVDVTFFSPQAAPRIWRSSESLPKLFVVAMPCFPP